MVKSICMNCGSGRVVRTGDDFKCEACGYEWTVADEQANANYLMASQGRKPAQPAGATLEDGLKQAVDGTKTSAPEESDKAEEPEKPAPSAKTDESSKKPTPAPDEKKTSSSGRSSSKKS